MIRKYVFVGFHLICILTFAQKPDIIFREDFRFLEEMVKDVTESSRIYPGQKLPAPFGSNHTGGVLIRPGGRDTYPAFWIRDYAMSIETGFVNKEEQKHMLLLTASTQCDQTWITRSGNGMIPVGAIADHILVETSLPIYYPGTYDYEVQEDNESQYGHFPPYTDQFFFIKMAYLYVKNTSDIKILKKEINHIKLIDRLELAFKVPPVRKGSHLVYTSETFLGVDFGFRDAEKITGDLVFPSIMKYCAANEIAWLFEKLQDKQKSERYNDIAVQIKKAIPETFLNMDGMLCASTGLSKQADVWSTALAVYLNILEDENMLKACRHLDQAYIDGKLAYKGNIRHIIKGEDYSNTSAWEISKVGINVYQNGAYWGTPTGWVTYAIAKVNTEHAMQLIKEFIDDLRENDYRKGTEYGAPYECIYPPGYLRGPVYLTTVTCPYIVLKAMREER
ncbi:hypothetical protein [uncultured Proteiniphilum sp.]|uniref:hypothetical protein n=1 Tax=uncultured Proteiniphilum sp. TaxID=497637 RepID=UPI002615E82A|nr:hypothetical protein [uncultured Proteiniphilum sp.]